MLTEIYSTLSQISTLLNFSFQIRLYLGYLIEWSRFSIVFIRGYHDFVSSEYIGVHVGLCRFLDSRPQNINRYPVAYITRGTVQSHYKHIVGQQAFA